MSNSEISLHTEPGCSIVNSTQTSTIINSTDCSYLANSNSGCGIAVPDPKSYGAAFAAAGGGVFVTEFAATAISCVVLPLMSRARNQLHPKSVFGFSRCAYPPTALIGRLLMSIS